MARAEFGTLIFTIVMIFHETFKRNVVRLSLSKPGRPKAQISVHEGQI